MKRFLKQKQLPFSYMQTTNEMFHFLGKEGYLSMPENSLSKTHEKKAGTSVNAISTQNYSATIPPPPIRPMVEKHPFYETATTAIKFQKSTEECA